MPLPAETETAVLDWLAERKEAMLDLIRVLVDIDSGSYDKAGVDEELLGAAHAACFAMSVANLVGERGGEATSIDAQATVNLEEGDGGFSVTRIELALVATVAGLDEATVVELAEQAKATCPISRALAGTEITLTVRFVEADNQPT